MGIFYTDPVDGISALNALTLMGISNGLDLAIGNLYYKIVSAPLVQHDASWNLYWSTPWVLGVYTQPSTVNTHGLMQYWGISPINSIQSPPVVLVQGKSLVALLDPTNTGASTDPNNPTPIQFSSSLATANSYGIINNSSIGVLPDPTQQKVLIVLLSRHSSGPSSCFNSKYATNTIASGYVTLIRGSGIGTGTAGIYPYGDGAIEIDNSLGLLYCSVDA